MKESSYQKKQWPQQKQKQAQELAAQNRATVQIFFLLLLLQLFMLPAICVSATAHVYVCVFVSTPARKVQFPPCPHTTTN